MTRRTVGLVVCALLLAAVRSAMLWRQLGGNQWQFLFARGAMGQALQGWLGR